MKRKQVYFSLFVIVSTALLIYSVVDRYNKELPKGLMDYSWQLSMLLDYPFFLFFFGFLPLVLFISERKIWVKRWFHKVYKAVFPLGLLLFTLLFLFFSDSCMNKKIVFSWDQVYYIGLAFLLHFGFCYCLWLFYFFEE
ncbi:hypothetical protein NG891_04900 [Enterococcus gallinarum]|uniref:hypothetical protein n=1 Tax=Enterococcus gallinarum TaxID=1353 RepID=UPI00209062D5|nr:hypothetical protein [Enterococcus gallinarum]MCO5476063.1 hypothetical protein [Enterococcus gallinarum]